MLNLDGESLSLHTPFPAASYLYLCCARARSRMAVYRYRYLALVPTWCPITTVAGRAARLISVPRLRAPFLLKGTFSKWKKKTRFKVRRGDLSLYALVLCRLALGFGFVYAPVALECFLPI